jgi:hypothetical protein
VQALESDGNKNYSRLRHSEANAVPGNSRDLKNPAKKVPLPRERGKYFLFDAAI